MDKFINKLDANTFRQTNAIWNVLMLNAPWSVGYVSHLIELKSFSSKEEWEQFYYDMGAYRLKKMASLSLKEQNMLNDESLVKHDMKKVKYLSQNLKTINTHHGRTQKELNHKGAIMYDQLKKEHRQTTLLACQEAVRFRVICETWNGIILREHNTIKRLKLKYPTLDFLKKDGQFDHKYAVDYEIYQNDELVCGIQIKPKSYLYKTPYLEKARAANHRKNELYKGVFDSPVLDVIAQHDGQVTQLKFFRRLEQMISPS